MAAVHELCSGLGTSAVSPPELYNDACHAIANFLLLESWSTNTYGRWN